MCYLWGILTRPGLFNGDWFTVAAPTPKASAETLKRSGPWDQQPLLGSATQQKRSGGIFVKLASLGKQGGGTLRMLLRTGFLNNDVLSRSIVIVCAYVCKLLQMQMHAQIVKNVCSDGFLKCRPQQTNWMNVTMMIVSHKFQARFVEFSLWNHADHDEMPPSKAYEHVLNPGTS